MSNFVDMTRQQVGAWRVIWRAPQAITGGGIAVEWTCRCACGVVRAVRGDVLRQFRSPSCGCMNRQEALAYEARVHRDENEPWHWTNSTH